jgi:hypothetical protein
MPWTSTSHGRRHQAPRSSYAIRVSPFRTYLVRLTSPPPAALS